MLKCKKSFKVDLRLAPIGRAVRPYAERASEGVCGLFMGRLLRPPEAKGASERGGV